MARKYGSIKTFSALWQQHEMLYLSVFENALNLLNVPEKLKNDEDSISESLCPILAQICFEKRIKKPDWEKSIPAIVNQDLKGGKNRKRPDFTCDLRNSFANSVDKAEIPFHVECKRLGKTTGSWNLNKNYVNDGVKRFDLKSHEYSKSAPSGLMIGYIIDMDPNTILSKINKYLNPQFPPLNFVSFNKITCCEQKLDRKVVKPRHFKLNHIWADLR